MDTEYPVTYTQLFHKAWPIMLANAAVPLLGFVDTAVIGNFGTTEDLGAIAFGALIFSFIYWGFGFLRMGTTGFIAQARGSGNESEVRAILNRTLFLALVLGVLLILAQMPISVLSFALLDGSHEIEQLGESYFMIRIWGAPATLVTFGLMGLLIGIGNSRQLLIVQVFLNGLNIILDIWFAGILNLGAIGIAIGTVVAEVATAIFAGFIVFKSLNQSKTTDEPFFDISNVFDKAALSNMVSANLNIMVRTLLQVFAFAYFINQSAQFSNIVLAANYILLQLISFAAFFLDGFAFVTESLIGQAIGAKSRLRFDLSVKRTSILATITAIFLALMVFFFGDLIINVLTDISVIQETATANVPLITIYILLSVVAFQLDGVFIGASCTQQMRNAALISLLIFLIACWKLVPAFGVSGLWRAMIIYVVARGITLLFYFPGLRDKSTVC